MHSRLKLPFRFDVARLRGETASLSEDAWVAHYNTRDYEGDWTGVALRSPGGRDGWLFPAPPGSDPCADTPTLARLPYLAQVLTTFECPLENARLLRLHAGSSIREHTDHALGFEDGLARLHVPVITNPDVTFYLDGEPVPMGEGECWYLDFNRPHRVDNKSAEHRVHLVIDCVVNDWLAAVFAETELLIAREAGRWAIANARIAEYERTGEAEDAEVCFERLRMRIDGAQPGKP